MNEGTPYTVALALRIRVRMAELDINQAELARRSGVSRAYLCRVVHGLTEPSCSMAIRLADALGLTLDELLRGGGEWAWPLQIVNENEAGEGREGKD